MDESLRTKVSGPAGRRPRTRPVRDNTAVAGLCSDAEASAAVSGAKSGGVANPFKSFLEACDCSDAEEALVEVGIERSALAGHHLVPSSASASEDSRNSSLAPQGIRLA